ncbi:MAG TPA: hypothetical protein VIV60_23440 [Polyangiaceae bacterium]
MRSSYTYLPEGEAERRGTLSSSEFDTLQSHTTRPALEALYAFAERDSEQCHSAPDGYYLDSMVGGACFVLANIADAHAREDVEYFANLFAQEAAAQ